MLTAAIVGSEVQKGSPLEVCLWQTGLVGYVRHWTLERLPSAGVSVPNVVILDVSNCAAACVTFAARLRELHPNILMIGWSASQSVSAELLLQAMRSGIQDFLSAPIDPAKLKKLLSHLAQRIGPDSGPGPKVIVVTGVKGGVGATTLASNLGVQLAGVTQKRVALLDFARPLGHVCLFLDLRPRFCVRDAVENLERLDDHFFTGLLSHHKSGLSVLAGTAHPDEWLRLPAAALAQVVDVARSSCEFVVVDTNSCYSPEWISCLQRAHALIMVTDVDVPTLSSLERHLSAMISGGIDPERLQVVVNRWHPHYEQVLKRFLERTKCSVIARLPNDFQQVSQAVTRGEALSGDHADPLITQYRDLAGQLAGIRVVAESKETRRSFFGTLRESTLAWRRTG